MPLPPEITALIRLHPLGTRRKTEQALSGNLEDAAKRYASSATNVGKDLELWNVWLAIQKARGLDLTSALVELPPQGLRFLGVAQLKAGQGDVGLAAYARYLKSPGEIGPFSHETRRFLDALSHGGRGEEAMQWVAILEARNDTTPAETLWAASYLRDTGKLVEAQERVQRVLTRHPDSADGWDLSAQIAHARGDASRATADAEKAAKRRAPSAFDYDENVAAFQQNPGQTLVPSEAPGPHWYGGDDYEMPACAGCGYAISQWFWLDLTAIARLYELLPNWPSCPLLGCSACMVWMGRHDYSVDHEQRRITLRNVAISTTEFGKPFGAPPKLQRRHAKLAPSKPIDSPFDAESTPLVGGAPLWTQSPELALCPECDAPMAYVAAMTTPLAFEPPFVINNESGFQYHFACNACRVLSVIAQWT